MVMYMIENGGAREDSDDFQSPLDLLFEALEDEDPGHIAVREYKIFKQAACKTAKSILIQAAVRLSAFILPQITDITARDDMELGLMGDRKQAVFAIIPDNDGTFNYLVGMLYTCAFQALYYQADKVHQGGLPVPVRLMMDEFCNVSFLRRRRGEPLTAPASSAPWGRARRRPSGRCRRCRRPPCWTRRRRCRRPCAGS